MTELLSVSKLCYSRGDEPIFSDLSFETEKGHPQFLYGRNGAGKTTLLRILAGLIEPDSGKILYPKYDGYLSLIAFLGHKDGLKTNLTAHENIQIELTLAGTRYQVDQIATMLQSWGLDSRLQHKPIAELSLGQRKRVALCLVQAKQARIWLLDEPMSALDLWGKEYALKVMATHALQGGIVILSQHERSQVHRVLLDLGGRDD